MNTSSVLSPATFIQHASDVSSFYGFRPIREFERGAYKALAEATTPRGAPAVARVRGIHSFDSAAQVCAASMSELSGPILAYYASPAPSYLPASYSLKDTGEFGLQAVGAGDSLGEVVLIKTIFAILSEWGATPLRIRINALGDKDSKARFERELSTYLRKHSHEFDEPCRQQIVQNPCATYTCQSDTCKEILADGPRAVNFLSEKSRSHFREVLEHIEKLDFPYELDDLLVGDAREPRIMFAIDLAEPDATVFGSMGGRHDEFVRRLANKKDAATVSAGIYFRKKGAERGSFIAQNPSPAPKVYFVQLGLRAKLQGLAVVYMLRQAQVPVSQSFDAKSLGTQLDSARRMGVSHLLIMGQREALDGTIILRSTQNSSQTTVSMAALPKLLRTLR